MMMQMSISPITIATPVPALRLVSLIVTRKNEGFQVCGCRLRSREEAAQSDGLLDRPGKLRLELSTLTPPHSNLKEASGVRPPSPPLF